MDDAVAKHRAIAAISSSLPLVVYANIQLVQSLRRGPPRDLAMQLAMADLVWLRGRWLLEFLLSNGRADTARARDHLPGWVVRDRALRKRLHEYHRQTTQLVAHLIPRPKADTSRSTAMPRDLVAAFRQFIDDAPAGGDIHEVLADSVKAAERMLADPDSATYP